MMDFNINHIIDICLQSIIFKNMKRDVIYRFLSSSPYRVIFIEKGELIVILGPSGAGKDTIVNEFAKRNFSLEEKQFYTNLVIEEINTFKKRISKEEWLSDKTKAYAVDKMNKISYTVGVPNNYIYTENYYYYKNYFLIYSIIYIS